MNGAHWMGTFRSALVSGDEKLIVSVLDTICKTERKDGMIEAAKIAASFSLEDEDIDTIVRRVAREIQAEALT